MRKQTTLEKALGFLPPQESEAEILKWHRHVGQLEELNAALERVIKALCRHYCGLRDNGYCDRQCPGRDYCDTVGLVALVLDLGKKRRVGQEGHGG